MIRTVRVGSYAFDIECGDNRVGLNWAVQCDASKWEAQIISLWERSIRPGDAVFDIGAFLGPYTLLASRLVGPPGTVDAVEPDPVIAAALQHTLSINGASNVAVHDCAIAATDGSAGFLPTADSMSHLSTEGQLCVKTKSLDSLCAAIGRVPDVIKVDIEGSEASFARSMPLALRRARLVIMEVHVKRMQQYDCSVSDLLGSIGPHQVLMRASPNNFHIAFGRGFGEGDPPSTAG